MFIYYTYTLNLQIMQTMAYSNLKSKQTNEQNPLLGLTISSTYIPAFLLYKLILKNCPHSLPSHSLPLVCSLDLVLSVFSLSSMLLNPKINLESFLFDLSAILDIIDHTLLLVHCLCFQDSTIYSFSFIGCYFSAPCFNIFLNQFP